MAPATVRSRPPNVPEARGVQGARRCKRVDYYPGTTPLLRQQAPDTPQAGAGEQTQLAVAGLPSQELQHGLRVSAVQPFLLVHPLSLPTIRSVLVTGDTMSWATVSRPATQ